jgi:hypothetical protein
LLKPHENQNYILTHKLWRLVPSHDTTSLLGHNVTHKHADVEKIHPSEPSYNCYRHHPSSRQLMTPTLTHVTTSIAVTLVRNLGYPINDTCIGIAALISAPFVMMEREAPQKPSVGWSPSYYQACNQLKPSRECHHWHFCHLASRYNNSNVKMLTQYW